MPAASIPQISSPQCSRAKLIRLLLLSFFAALLFQLICSRSSPLYAMNDWVDVNCFFTTGKSVLRGKVLYRDIYEQKGPLLYFIYALIAAISDTSFIGAFIVHVIAVTLFLFFSARIILFLKEDAWYAALCIPVLALITHACKAFLYGGSVEELTIWMLSASLFFCIRAIKESQPLRIWECGMIGIFAGTALYIKYTSLGFYFGIALFVLIWYIRCKFYRRLFSAILWFFAGIALVSLPVFLYFGIHNAIPDFIQAYFLDNITIYSKSYNVTSIAALNKILTIGAFTVKAILENPVFALLIVLGFLYLIFSKSFDHNLLPLVFLSVFFLIIAAFWGRYHAYYALILAPFSVFGFCALKPRRNFKSKIAVGAVLVLSLGLSFFFCDNTYMLRYEKEDYAPYRFAQKINTVENASLLNYGFLDGGFYHAANIEPSSKFFCRLNIALPEMYDAQNKIVENGEVDFVVTAAPMESPLYQLVDAFEFRTNKVLQNYYLYQNINTLPEN